MGVVHSSRGSARPASKELISEPSIVAGIASALETNLTTRALLGVNLLKTMI